MRKFRRKWSTEIRRFVEAAAWESNVPAPTVLREMENRFPGVDLPNERTLRDWLKELRRDPTEAWTLAEDYDSQDVAFLLKVQSAAIQYLGATPGGLWSAAPMTLADVQWLLRFKDACAGMPDHERWRLVRLLVNEVLPLEVIQPFLAFRPWLGFDESRAYKQAIDNSDIPAPPERGGWLLWSLTVGVKKDDAQD
jgi:hypothetical protein